MLTPAEELLAAVKEHATADVSFDFVKQSGGLAILDVGAWRVRYDSAEEEWIESCRPVHRENIHASASSAVYSAFLRARGKQL